MSSIQPVAKVKVIDYGDRELTNFWLKKENGGAVSETINHYDQIKSLLAPTTVGILCIQSEELSDKTLIKALFKAADKGDRIYIMTNDYNPAMKELQGCCLIRYGLKNLGSFLLGNLNTTAPSGVFFTGPLSEGALNLSSNLMIDLDAEQTGILYRHFCFHFWNTAAKEVAGDNSRDTDASPIDIFPCTGNFCDSEFAKNSVKAVSDQAEIITNSITLKVYYDFNTSKDATIVTSLFGNNSDLLPLIKNAGNNVFAINKGSFINVFKNSSECWIIPKSTVQTDDIFYALKLNDEQRRQIEKRFEIYKSNAEYEFFALEQRKNIAGKTILPLDAKNANESFLIEQKTTRKLPNNQRQGELLSEDALNNAEPEFPDDGKSVTIEYTWDNMPFYLPQNSAKHPLYSQWEEKQKEIRKTLSKMLEDISKIEKKKDSLAEKVVKRLTRFFLGKQVKSSEKRDKIKELEEAEWGSLSQDKCKAKIEEINAILLEIKKEDADTEEEIRSAKIAQEIEDKEAELKTKQQELEQKTADIASKKQEQEKLTNLLEQLKEKEGNIETSIRSIEKTQEELEKKKSLLEAKRIEIQTISALKQEQEKAQEVNGGSHG
ncbi:hypothetical protein FACS1894172_04330 [Spirochaetia bacterium]|nr:hypothetical protein FACS1894172_04330 [Spirochaetia bacterium]